jgi:hypothetical protein
VVAAAAARRWRRLWLAREEESLRGPPLRSQRPGPRPRRGGADGRTLRSVSKSDYFFKLMGIPVY